MFRPRSRTSSVLTFSVHRDDAPGFDDIIVLVFRDGLLWRSIYYASVDETLAAHPA
jgi:hypothetical protein